MKEITTDICVIGGGSGGLSVAAGASQLGAQVVLIEGEKMGGDCLNYGCVPSKSMIAAANAAHIASVANKFGVEVGELDVDFRKVYEHVHNVIDAIAPHDSVERFEGLGVKVVQAHGKFVGPTEVQAGNTIVKAKRVVISTGSHADTPLIEGLDTVPYLTNKTIFDLTEKPSKLLIIGGGPTGSELAQAHRRLGCDVTIVDIKKILSGEDPELSEIVRTQMLKEGVVIREDIEILCVARHAEGVTIKIRENDKEDYISGSHLLVVSGRVPHLAGLNLDAAGIEYSHRGIKVDERLRTSNKKVFAIGDCVGGLYFTHVASYHAGVVVRNALFRLPAKVNYSSLSRVTFTDPELAHVGLTEKQARAKYCDIRILRHPFSDNDRALAEADISGLAKVITTAKGVIVGASIVGPRAGELIQPWILPIKNKMKIGTIAGLIIPYPTLGEINKRAAGSFYTPKLFNEKTKKFVRFLLKLG